MEDAGDRRVLVGVDRSAPSIEALRCGARIAAALGAPLEAVTVWTFPPDTSPYPIGTWKPREGAIVALDQAIEAAFGASPPAIRRIVLSGHVSRTLVAESDRSGMLVLGSRGQGGFAGMLLGSVSATCAEHAHCPVLIVHAPARARRGSAVIRAAR